MGGATPLGAALRRNKVDRKQRGNQVAAAPPPPHSCIHTFPPPPPFPQISSCPHLLNDLRAGVGHGPDDALCAHAAGQALGKAKVRDLRLTEAVLTLRNSRNSRNRSKQQTGRGQVVEED